MTMGNAWTARGIQTRVLLLVGIGILASLAILGGAAWFGLNSISGRLAAERETLARTIADHLDWILQGELAILQGIPSSPGFALADSDIAPEQSALREAYLRSRLSSQVMLVERSGTVIASEPTQASRPDPADVEAAFSGGRPVVSPLRQSGSGKRLYLLLPLRDWRGEVFLLGVSGIDPTGSRFVPVLSPFDIGRTGVAELLDERGVVLAGSDRKPTFAVAQYWPRIAPALQQRGSHVAIVEGASSTVLAAARLQSGGWSVAIRQDEAEAFAEARNLRRTIAWLAPTLLGLALLFAWGAARSVRRPLAQLTRSAERIASGDLDQPIPRLPEDEVGRLGRSLEHMRIALKSSLEEIATANLELEQRVASRTRELRMLYSELQERDKWREELLRKVISAQEDERRRLARELHDETSQTLSALAMKLETALAAWPGETSRERLLEARGLNVRTIEELHRLIFDLRPSVLDDLGLLSAIRWYAERHLEPLGVAVQFEASGFETRLLPELETALFRVAQEAITNVEKHSEADTVLIQCLERDGRVLIEIEDDGKGFSPESLPPPAARERGLGLLGMRERVELFGGSIEIDSAPGRGTRIAVSVPVQEAPGGKDSSSDRR